MTTVCSVFFYSFVIGCGFLAALFAAFVALIVFLMIVRRNPIHD